MTKLCTRCEAPCGNDRILCGDCQTQLSLIDADYQDLIRETRRDFQNRRDRLDEDENTALAEMERAHFKKRFLWLIDGRE